MGILTIITTVVIDLKDIEKEKKEKCKNKKFIQMMKLCVFFFSFSKKKTSVICKSIAVK